MAKVICTDDHPPAAGHAGAHLEVDQVGRLGLEAVGQLGRAAHRPAEQDAADRERLLDERRHVGHLPLALGGDPLALAPTRRVIQTNSGSRPSENAASRQSSANIATDGGEHRGQVGDDRGRRGGDDVLHAADVVGDPRLDLAGAGAGEEGERQALEVAVDGGAQVVHDALADGVGEQRLPDAEHAGDDGDGDHPEARARSAGSCRPAGSPVEHLAQQERRRPCPARPRRRSGRARRPGGRGRAGTGRRCAAGVGVAPPRASL